MAIAQPIVVLDQGIPAAVLQTSPEHGSQCVDHHTVLSASWLLVHVASGSGRFSGPSLAGEIEPGTLLSLPPGLHTFDHDADHRITLVVMREPADPPQGVHGFSFPMARRLSRFESRRWAGRLEAIAGAVAASRFGDGDALALRADLFDLQWLPIRHDGRETVHGALASMWERLEQPLRIEDLAQDRGYTANYLNDLTRLNTGRSLGRWLEDMRMSRARGLLARTQMPVAEVGAAAGYADPAYFSRVFRRAHGAAPGVWRIAHRPDDARYARVTTSFLAMNEVDSRVAASF